MSGDCGYKCSAQPSACVPAQYGFPSAGNWYDNKCSNLAPCGKVNVADCAGNCWDTSLCYLPEPVCEPGDRKATIAAPTTAARLSADARSSLSIYNYSVQRVISRTLKFVASYNDWVWQQNQDGCESNTNEYTDNCNGGQAAANGQQYLPSFTCQLFHTLGFLSQQVGDVNLCGCFCKDMCGVVQLLSGLDGSATIRNFILDNALDCCGEKQQLGCGRGYDEDKLIQFGKDVVSVIDLIIHVLRTLDADNDSARAEAVLKKFCRCIIQAAAAENCSLKGLDNGSQAEIRLAGLEWFECGSDTGNNPARRQQAFAAIVDLIQFILFDRDCDFSAKDGDCTCCPEPPSVEQWVDHRCRRGTGEGRCLVCSAGCSKYRRQDDFNPMLSSLYAIKYYFKLATVARDGAYGDEVGSIYQEIVDQYYDLYKNSSGSLSFYPDCAAPTFCCSTENVLKQTQAACCCDVTDTGSITACTPCYPRLACEGCEDQCYQCPQYVPCDANTDCCSPCPDP